MWVVKIYGGQKLRPQNVSSIDEDPLMLMLEAPDSYATSPNKEGRKMTTTNS